MRASAVDEAPLGTRAGEYEVTGILGRGGMGTVYAGVHPVIGTEVAIKVIDPRLAGDADLVERFIQEARAVNKIRHSSIIEIFAFGESPDLGFYLVMPRLHGQTLEDRIASGGPLAVGQALPILRQIADALDAAHEAGVLHRDLKPANIFLSTERSGPARVKVLDFGIAKLTDGDAVATTGGGQLGTPLFMSPEQWHGQTVDRRTDIYALGVLLHHMLTGRYPFEASSPVHLMTMHVQAPPTPASEHGAPGYVDGVIARALAKEPDDRYQSAGALRESLATAAAAVRADDVAFDATMTPAAFTAATRPGLPKPRRRLWIVAALLGVAAVAVAIGLAAGRGDDAAPAPAAAAATVDARVATPDAAVAPADAVPADAAPRPEAVELPAETPRRRSKPRRPDPEEPKPKASGWGETVKPF